VGIFEREEQASKRAKRALDNAQFNLEKQENITFVCL